MKIYYYNNTRRTLWLKVQISWVFVKTQMLFMEGSEFNSFSSSHRYNPNNLNLRESSCQTSHNQVIHWKSLLEKWKLKRISWTQSPQLLACSKMKKLYAVSRWHTLEGNQKKQTHVCLQLNLAFLFLKRGYFPRTSQ